MVATIYQIGSDSVYDSGGSTYYANGANAGSVYTATTPTATAPTTSTTSTNTTTPTNTWGQPISSGGGTIVPQISTSSVPSPSPTPSISSSTLTPPPTTTYQQPASTSVYPTSTLQAPDFSLTAPEQKASDLSTSLQSLENSLVGKSAYQTQENTAFGVDAAQKSITDLTTQLNGIKNEAAAIPLQLQQGAADRGVTTPVLGAQENSRLRTNAIAALGVSTLLNAAQGNLATAQSMADKAVAQKYDPIEEQIKAGLANLQLIMNSPDYTEAEKQRAFQQQQYLQQQAEQVAQQKTDYANILKISTDAASNIKNFVANGQYQTASQALQAMSQATSPQQALQIAASTGLTNGATAADGTKVLGSATTGYYSYNPSTGAVTPIAKPGSTSAVYQAGMLTTLLQSQGKTADDATLQSLWQQYGNGGTYTNDTAHNSIIYSAMGGKLPTTTSSTSSTGYKFTPTQLNTGAAKAAMSLSSFQSLAGDVQNFYVHATTANLSDLQSALQAVKDGSVSAQDAKSQIDSLNLAAAVKTYFKSLIDQVAPSAPAPNSTGTDSSSGSGSFLGDLWSGIISFLGY